MSNGVSTEIYALQTAFRAFCVVFAGTNLVLELKFIQKFIAKQKKWTVNTVFVLAALVFFFCMPLGIIVRMSFEWNDMVPPESCKIAGLLISNSYFVGKASMFMSFTQRLIDAYGRSAYAYSMKSIIALRIFICIGVGITMVGFGFTVESEIIRVGSAGQCVTTFSTAVIGFMLLFEFTTSIILLILFIRPLVRSRRAIREQGTSKASAKKSSDQFLRLAIKCTILAVFGISSSILTYIFGAIPIYDAAYFDAGVSGLVLILMHHQYRHLYRRFCDCIDKRVYRSVSGKEALPKESDAGGKVPLENVVSGTADPSEDVGSSASPGHFPTPSALSSASDPSNEL